MSNPADVSMNASAGSNPNNTQSNGAGTAPPVEVED